MLQAHPYMIAWSEQDRYQASRLISLLVERQRGFSARLRHGQMLNITLDGPYGRGAPLEQYDKVIFIASGVGLAAHMLHIRELLQAHQMKTAQARRICLIWVIDNKGKPNS
jgi:predicted ferric reductase